MAYIQEAFRQLNTFLTPFCPICLPSQPRLARVWPRPVRSPSDIKYQTANYGHPDVTYMLLRIVLQKL